MMLWEEYRAVHARRLRLQPLLRAVPRVRAPAVAEHAADTMSPATRCSSTTPARRSRSPIRRPARCARPRSSSPCSAPPTSPTPRRPGRRPARLDRRACPHVPLLGGVPRLLVPDNLKSGVHKASFYDPEINRSYGAMAAHYGVGVLPARPHQPEGQSQSRGRSPLRSVLHPRPAAQPELLLARRMQRGDRRDAWCS